jgi:hypothetical protein
MGGAETQEKEIIMSKPAHKIRSGVLQVTIWRNHSEKGNWYSVIPSRSYRNGEDAWKETDSLGFEDLLPMRRPAGTPSRQRNGSTGRLGNGPPTTKGIVL